MKRVGATVPSTGEVISLTCGNPEQTIENYRVAQENIEAWTDVKKQLQKLAVDIVDSRGQYEHDGYLLRVSSIQRQQYDKAVLRQVFDPDLLETFLEPAKGKIDAYIKEHVEELGPDSTLLRQTMVPTGHPYRLIRLEKLNAD